MDESEREKLRSHGVNTSPKIESTMPNEEEAWVTAESKGTAKREGGDMPVV